MSSNPYTIPPTEDRISNKVNRPKVTGSALCAAIGSDLRQAPIAINALGNESIRRGNPPIAPNTESVRAVAKSTNGPVSTMTMK